MQKKIIIYIILIIVILASVFLSQQAYSRDFLENILSYIEKNAGASLIGGFNNLGSGNINSSKKSTTNESATTNATNNDKNLIGTASSSSNTQKPIDTVTAPGIGVYIKKVGASIKSGEEAITNGVNNTKEKISENISGAEKNIQNYFSGIANSVLHPGENNNTNCPPVAPATTANQ